MVMTDEELKRWAYEREGFIREVNDLTTRWNSLNQLYQFYWTTDGQRIVIDVAPRHELREFMKARDLSLDQVLRSTGLRGDPQ